MAAACNVQLPACMRAAGLTQRRLMHGREEGTGAMAQAPVGALLRARFAGALAHAARAAGGARVLREAGGVPALLGALAGAHGAAAPDKDCAALQAAPCASCLVYCCTLTVKERLMIAI